MRAVQLIEARGHRKISALHRTTFEITTDDHLTPQGDCIIAVSASKGAADLSQDFRKVACNDRARITANLRVGTLCESARGFGSDAMCLDHPTDLVFRKSSYVCGRTLAIRGNLAACGISRRFVRLLQDPLTRVEVELIAEI
ncbi:MAG: DUF371 domain-containing protein [archaeon]